jgi:glycosyltransferase involved in cell wall biosynthesis
MNNHDKSILHISFDFPDSIDSKKTKAVYNLVSAQNSYKNVIFSLNRTANPFADFGVKKNKGCFSLNIFGLPFGFGLYLWMYIASKRIIQIIKREKLDIHIIHGHKLSFEGIIAILLGKKINVPYIITVRGDTDIKLVKFKKLSYWIFKEILIKSSKIIYLAPWTSKAINELFKPLDLTSKSVIIPNIITLISIKTETNKTEFIKNFVSVFNLDRYRRKNIKRTIEAINNLHNEYPKISLDIIGEGKKGYKVIEAYINKCKYPEQFKLIGQKSHHEVLKLYSSYAGFIMPSYPETFGLVFIEAINSGIPIIYSKNSGVDGFFDGWSVGEKVNDQSIREIEIAIEKIFINNLKYRESINTGIKRGELNKFNEQSVNDLYSKTISEILENT